MFTPEAPNASPPTPCLETKSGPSLSELHILCDTMDGDLDSLEASADLRSHQLTKTYKFTDESIILVAKLGWEITTPPEVPSNIGNALLNQLLVLPNEQRRVLGRVEVFVGDQQANGAAIFKRLMQSLETVNWCSSG
jgi:hypothetical protein